MERRNPGLSKAVSWLRLNIENRSFAAGQRIPSIRKCARLADVSYVTMRRAVLELCNDGTLLREKGYSTIVSQDSPKKTAAKEPDNTYPRWQLLAEVIEKDILSGQYRPGRRLPDSKQLMNRYHVAHNTVRNALHRLAKTGAIEMQGRGYAVPAFHAAQQKKRIVLYILAGKQAGIDLSEFGQAWLRHFEGECARAGLVLDIRTFLSEKMYSAGRQIPRTPPVKLEVHENIAGYIFYVKGLDSIHNALLHQMAHANAPVAVLDEWSASSLPSFVEQNRMFRIFGSVPFNRPGIEAGRLLTHLGHRFIAYISAFHGTPWSQKRLEGIRQVIKSMRDKAAVIDFTDSRYDSIDFSIKDGMRRMDFDGLNAWRKRWEKSQPEAFLDVMATPLGHTLRRKCGEAEAAVVLEDLFKQALKDSRITAWVCANDFTALAGLRFLERNSIPVPGKISVVGFDDTFETVTSRLTSYNPNIEGIAVAMLRFLLYPHSSSAQMKRGRVQIDGFFVERESVCALPSVKQE